jgi:hypothetical protein
MFFNLRRDCPDPEANAASVPTLTSRGSAAVLLAGGFEAPPLAVPPVEPPPLAAPLVETPLLTAPAVAAVDFASVDLAAVDLAAALDLADERFAGADLAPAFLAVAFDEALDRTGRSLIAHLAHRRIPHPNCVERRADAVQQLRGLLQRQ